MQITLVKRQRMSPIKLPHSLLYTTHGENFTRPLIGLKQSSPRESNPGLPHDRQILSMIAYRLPIPSNLRIH